MANVEQSYANHRRLPPIAFQIAFVVIAADVIVRAVAAIKAPSLTSTWAVVVMAAILMVAYYARRNAQIVQDRLIMLETRRRLQRLLPAEQQDGIAKLTRPQLIALRFASDEELPALASATLTEQLSNDAIKQRVQQWQADWQRV